jgi:hypothetical protein
MLREFEVFSYLCFRLKDLFKAEGKEGKKVARYDLDVKATDEAGQKVSI